MAKQLPTTNLGGFSVNISSSIGNNNTKIVLAALKNAKARGLKAIGETAEGHAKDVIIEEQRVDTGNMLNSINHKETEDYTEVGTAVEYAKYQELGTSRGIKPARFLTRAATEHTEEYRALMENSLKNA